MKYWLWINGSQEGPFDLQEISDKLANGLSPLTLCLPAQGPGDWGPTSSLNLNPPLATPPSAIPHNPQTQSSTSTPALAFIAPIPEPSIARIFSILATLAFIAGCISCLVSFNEKEPRTGVIYFLLGILSALSNLAISHILNYLYVIAERLRYIEITLKTKP
jgi:hypothetical protein